MSSSGKDILSGATDQAMSSISAISDSDNDCKDCKTIHYYLAGIDHNYITDKDKAYKMLWYKYTLQLNKINAMGIISVIAV